MICIEEVYWSNVSLGLVFGFPLSLTLLLYFGCICTVSAVSAVSIGSAVTMLRAVESIELADGHSGALSG